MESILIHTHSGIRWIFLLMLLFVLFKNHNNPASDPRKKIDWPLYTLILFLLQILLGFVLYFISNNVSFEPGFMKNSHYRFFTIEHETGMLLAFIIMLIGYIKSRRTLISNWNKVIKTWYLISLIIILLSIPWPFRGFGNSWF